MTDLSSSADAATRAWERWTALLDCKTELLKADDVTGWHIVSEMARQAWDEMETTRDALLAAIAEARRNV